MSRARKSRKHKNIVGNGIHPNNKTINEGELFANAIKVAEEDQGLAIAKRFEIFSEYVIKNAYMLNDGFKNRRTKSINFDGTDIEKMIKSSNEIGLREQSLALAQKHYEYYKLLKTYADILLYNWYYYPYDYEKNINNYMDKIKEVDKLLKEFQLKRVLREVCERTLFTGKQVIMPRVVINEKESGRKRIMAAGFQIIPEDFTWIIGENNISKYTVMFDLMYFVNNPYDSIENYDLCIQDAYFGIQESSTNKNKFGATGRERVSIDLSKYSTIKESTKNNAILRSQIKFFENTPNPSRIWIELPWNKAFVISADESFSLQAPMTMGLFIPTKNLEGYEKLQQRLQEIPADIGLVLGSVQTINSNLGNISTDQIAVSRAMMNTYERLFLELTSGSGIKFFSAPATPLSFEQFKGIEGANDISMKSRQTWSAMSGTIGINPVDTKPTAPMIEVAREISSRYVDTIYEQINRMMDIILSDYCNNEEISFGFRMFGDIFNDKKKREIVSGYLSTGQNNMMYEQLAINGQTILDALNMSRSVKEIGLYDGFEVLQSAYNTSSSNVGRPSQDYDDMTSEGTASSAGNREVE
jgi:hypothetical protein